MLSLVGRDLPAYATPRVGTTTTSSTSCDSCYIVDVARRRGRILAVKWGMNPNSSSLGVDVTFLLVGATVVSMITPVLGAILRWRSNKPGVDSPSARSPAPAGDSALQSRPRDDADDLSGARLIGVGQPGD